MEQTVKKGSSKAWVRIYKCRWLYVMFLPVILYYVLFCYMPMFGVVIAFEDYNAFRGIKGSIWVGFKYFEQFFSSIYFWRLIRNTFLLSFYGLIFGFPAPILLALLFNELKDGLFKKVTQTISYLPHFVSTVIIVGLYVTFLSPDNGLINNIISALGGNRVYFLAQPGYFRALYTILDIWKGIGWGTIIYLAALTNVDPQLYEACIIDGGGYIRQLIHITLPSIVPTIVIMLIFRVGNLLSVGSETVLLMYSPSIYETSDIIATYVYRRGLLDADYSFSTAVGIFNSIVATVLLVITNTVARKTGEVSLW